MTKDKAIAMAQRSANREQKPMVVVNLNPYAALWVVRDWQPTHDLIATRDTIIKIEPQSNA
jgi:hypothetical protein